MADFVSEVVTKENLDEFKECLISGGISWEAERKITIADDVPFKDVLPSKTMKNDEQNTLSRILINTVYHSMDSHRDEVSALLKQGKKAEACKVCRMEELADLDQKDPAFVAKIINMLGNSTGGFYGDLIDVIGRRSPERNFVLAQHTDLRYYAGKETNITELSKEDANALRALWQCYDHYRVSSSYNRSKEDVNAHIFLEELLKRGDLLNCKHLTEEQRNLAIDMFPKRKLLERIDEPFITRHLTEQVIESPDSYLDLYNSEPLNTPEIQKIEKAMFRTLKQMPKYDAARYGYEKGLNERFDDLLVLKRKSTFEKLDNNDRDAFVSAMYLRTAQQDVLDGHADKLSAHALSFVLRYDKQGVFARKITPQVFEKAQKDSERQGNRLFNTLHDEIFIIYREQPADIYDLTSTVQSQAFKKLTFKEREDKIKISEFAEKAKILELPEYEAKEAVAAMQMVLRGEGDKICSSDKKASEIAEKVETSYQKRKESYKLRIENTEKAYAVERSCQQKASRDKNAYDTISSLQAVYDKILGSTKTNPPQKKEAHLAKPEMEELISSAIEGRSVQLSVPDYGGLPLFGRDKEDIRRRQMRQDIENFNEVLHTIYRSSSLKEDLKEYDTKLLEPSTKEQAGQKADSSQKTSTEVSSKVEEYNKEFLYKDDTEGKIADILKYAQGPLDRYKVSSISYMYDFMEKVDRCEKRVSEARLENETYVEALKEVAKEKEGTANEEKLPVVTKGLGEKTHKQRAELKKASDQLDKLNNRKAGQNTDRNVVIRTKNEIHNAQQRLKFVKKDNNREI